MDVWLFLASLLLTVATTRAHRRRSRWTVPPWTYRRSVLASVGLAVPVWCWSHWSGGVPSRASLATVAGAFLGGLVTTTSTVGLAEENAPPSPGVRQKVLAYHAGLRYPAEPRLKRVLDVTLALLGLAVTAPLWIVVALLIWFEEPGPILFIKNSVGRGGVTFRQLKFRSMRYDAERLTGPIASPACDPRTLRCGRWLRRWHVDELPELVNVLNGSMSIVGPRPLRTVLVQRYLEEIPGFAERHVVRPGIACIAQIEKYHIAPAERLRKDKVYIRRMSVGMDVRMLGRAVVTTVRGERES
ncbi:Sugar transferase involved in LPS biosynthesis (colanic, teichoic acid) [Micromonospora pattaloongensis]|uniref:Sugar transferase involved in LPS biosynthesis (Colanic, teichoic acid) n=1 Tax=Micromonospora pattaloongensis TaxID=405436 RepID=A0A1H3HIX9_9ACTN|nr:sugar transferase [Micromonospora pattaloongensis]SDY14758.1 Sugar transferase involved in LPS biosynthesis (colanic, teichoic acid) [Micromonospora pattaloongensis]